MKHHAILILWPSFVVAGAANALFWTFFDPADFTLFGPFGLSRMTAYSTEVWSASSSQDPSASTP